MNTVQWCLVGGLLWVAGAGTAWALCRASALDRRRGGYTMPPASTGSWPEFDPETVQSVPWTTTYGSEDMSPYERALEDYYRRNPE